MDQAILAGEHLDKAAELLDRDDLAAINLADLDLGGHAFDLRTSLGHASLAHGVDIDGAIVLDVDLAAGFLDDALDVLATRPDECADLLRIDLDGEDARGVLAQLRTRRRQCASHGFEHEQAGVIRAIHRFIHDAQRDAGQLQVQLEPGDALGGAGDLAIHVAERIFPADDVGEQLIAFEGVVFVVLRAQADAHARHRADQGHAGVHEGESSAAHRGHRAGAVGFGDFAGDADRVRELLQREHGLNGTLSKRSVADFTTAGAGDASGFTDREIREIVVQDEFLLRGAAGVGVELLGILAGAEGGQSHRLGFTAGEDGRPVRTGEATHLGGQRTDIREPASIQAFALFKDQAADSLLLQDVERLLEHVFGGLFLAELLEQLGANLGKKGFASGLAVELARGEQRRHQAVSRQGPSFIHHVRIGSLDGDGALGPASSLHQVLLGGDDGLDAFLRELEGGLEIGIWNFTRRSLEHQHFLFIAHINDVQVAGLHLFMGGVGDEGACNTSHAHSADGASPGDVAHAQGGRCAVHRKDVGVVFAVRAEDDALNLHFIQPVVREEGPDGPVDQARGEDFLFRGTPFAFEITAGKFACRTRFFAVIDSEGEEALARLGLAGGNSRNDDDGLTQLDRDGAIGLLGQFARFDDDLAASNVGRGFYYHMCISLPLIQWHVPTRRNFIQGRELRP